MLPHDAEVYIVEDDETLRNVMARLLTTNGYAVRPFPSALAFLDALSDLGPGCVLLDVRLPDLDGLELHQRAQRAGACLPVIFMSGYGDIPTSVRAMKEGAFDFLTKPVEEQTLLQAVQAALREEARVRVERVELEELQRRYLSLTPRETEVMQLVLAGRLNKHVAHELGISEKTVKVHRARVMSKMGVRSVAVLMRYALRIGLFASEPERGHPAPLMRDARARVRTTGGPTPVMQRLRTAATSRAAPGAGCRPP